MTKIKFGTGGFRGVIAEDFTKENVQKICQAIANIAEKRNLKKDICIGYDNRFLSEYFAKWCSEVLAANNFNVEFFKTATSTPVVMYQSKKMHNDFGIMITASHNPFKYNGIKVFVKDGKDASIENTHEIEEEFDKIEKIKAIEFENAQNITIKNRVNEYVDFLIETQNIPSCDGLNVVFDAKNGSTVSELKQLVKKLNIKNYKIINSKRDAFFNFCMPSPTIDNVEKLKKAVKDNNADIGFALDADGDRLGIIDKNGNYIDNNYILSLVYYYLAKYENKIGGSVKNVATSILLDEVTNKFNQTCHEVPVGFKYISSKLIETNSIVGGESSGGLAVQNYIWGKDSLLSIALCLKIIKKINKPFDDIIIDLKKFANDFSKVIFDKQYSYSLSQEKEIKDKIFIDKLLPIHRYDVEKVVYTDYLKIYYKNKNWVLIRFSGTEPVLRIFVETDSKIESDQLIQDWENFLNLN